MIWVLTLFLTYCYVQRKSWFLNDGSEPGRNPPSADAALTIISCALSPSFWSISRWKVGCGMPNVSLISLENVTQLVLRGLTFPNQRKSTINLVSTLGATSPYEKASLCTWQYQGLPSETGLQHCMDVWRRGEGGGINDNSQAWVENHYWKTL